jgi:hypothetical protein
VEREREGGSGQKRSGERMSWKEEYGKERYAGGIAKKKGERGSD